MPTLTVVKIGGSLYDLPDLGPRLTCWLTGLDSDATVVVPGGGAAADVIRELDRRQRLGDEKAHWLALRALALNAYFLADLLSGVRVLESIEEIGGGLAVLDPLAFCRDDERRHPSTALPHSWAVTSDSVAARVAVASGAQRLILLKSVGIPPDLAWEDAARQGLVDEAFPGIVRTVIHLEIRAINFRERGS